MWNQKKKTILKTRQTLNKGCYKRFGNVNEWMMNSVPSVKRVYTITTRFTGEHLHMMILH